jgi:hypothetical protein
MQDNYILTVIGAMSVENSNESFSTFYIEYIVITCSRDVKLTTHPI